MARPKKVNLEEKVKEKITDAESVIHHQLVSLIARSCQSGGNEEGMWNTVSGRYYGHIESVSIKDLIAKHGEELQEVINNAVQIHEMNYFLYDVLSEIEEMKEAHQKEILKIKGGGIEFDDKRRSGKDSGEPSKPRKLSTDEAQEKQESQGNGEIPDSDSDKDKDSQED